jgi:hypothetical protein
VGVVLSTSIDSKKIAINRFVAKDWKKTLLQTTIFKKKTSKNTPVILYTSL